MAALIAIVWCLTAAGCSAACPDGKMAAELRKAHRAGVDVGVGGTVPGMDSPPIVIAATLGDCQAVRWLIARGVDVNATSLRGDDALSGATGGGYGRIMTLLLRHGADPNRPDAEGTPPLHYAFVMAMEHKRLQPMRILLKRGADPDVLGSDGWPLLMTAPVLAGEFSESPDFPGKTHDKAILIEVVTLLLEYRADPDLATPDGWTPLMMAAQQGVIQMVALLLDHGADVNARTDAGMTALMLSGSAMENAPVARLLLERGAAVNVANVRGETALHQAAMRGFHQLVHTLLEHGADVGLRDQDGNTAAELAARGGHTAVLEMLRAGVPSQ